MSVHPMLRRPHRPGDARHLDLRPVERPASTASPPPCSGVPALAEAYVRRRDALKALLTRRTRDPSASEDLLQDLWLRIERARGDAPRDPDAYLQTMAINLARDWLAGQSRRTQLHHPDGDAADILPTEEPDAERALASRQAVAFLMTVIERLPERRREALLLYRFEGLSVAEVARRMGISRRTAEHTVASAIAACHTELLRAGFRP